MKNIKVKMQIGDSAFFRPTCGFKNMDAALSYLEIVATRIGVTEDYKVILIGEGNEIRRMGL